MNERVGGELMGERVNESVIELESVGRVGD